jgi:xanthine/uracil permease
LQPCKILYDLNEKPTTIKCLTYAFQWTCFILAGNIFFPIALANALGLDTTTTAKLVQSSLFLVGIQCFLQVMLGHKLPIVEGIAGLWFSIFLLFITSGGDIQANLSTIMGQIQFCVISTGIFMIILAKSNLLLSIKKIFTPIVTGSTILLLALQISGTFIKGITKFDGQSINWQVSLLSLSTIIFVTYLSFHKNTILRSYNTLIGLSVGWLAYVVLHWFQGRIVFSMGDVQGLIHLPTPFPWGYPTLSINAIVTSLIAAIVVISNQMASTAALSETLDVPVTGEAINRGGLVNGLGHIFAGILGAIPTIPYATSASFISINGVASKYPFIFSSILLMIFSILTPVTDFFANIPPSVAYSVSFIVFSQMATMGISNYQAVEMNQKNMLIIGMTLFTGIGIMLTPSTAFNALPSFLSNVLSNGLLTSLLLAIFLEQVVFRKKEIKLD